jgi:hypothetical protein
MKRNFIFLLLGFVFFDLYVSNWQQVFVDNISGPHKEHFDKAINLMPLFKVRNKSEDDDVFYLKNYLIQYANGLFDLSGDKLSQKKGFVYSIMLHKKSHIEYYLDNIVIFKPINKKEAELVFYKNEVIPSAIRGNSKLNQACSIDKALYDLLNQNPSIENVVFNLFDFACNNEMFKKFIPGAINCNTLLYEVNVEEYRIKNNLNYCQEIELKVEDIKIK